MQGRKLAPKALTKLPLIGGYLADVLGTFFLHWASSKYKDLSSGTSLDEVMTVAAESCEAHIITEEKKSIMLQ